MSDPGRLPAKERLPNDGALGVIFGVIAAALALHVVIQSVS
jgi:hypothetical protein